ncbi:MAG: hypothetical protein IJY42_06385 [Clostridia bacterium]|nr:hypothetical protein [Clostridia bacterium]
MSITNFIPTVWSETLHTELDKRYIAVSHCYREFEGEIKNRGSVVRICGVGDIAVNPYVKNTDMSIPQTLSDTVRELAISNANYFNFQIDDIDRAQSNPRLMEAAMKMAAGSLANEADRYVFGLHDGHEQTVEASSATAENIADFILAARQKLYENNVYDTEEVVVEVSPAVASLILKAKIKLATDNGEALEAGCIGSMMGCRVFVSNNIAQVDSVHKCFVRTKRAIAFAEQLSEIDAYRPEKRFADAVKGLHLFGAGIIYPKELVVMNTTLSA